MPLLSLISAFVLFLDYPPRFLRHVFVVIAAVTSLLLRHQVFPVLNYRVHHHIEYGRRQWVALSDASLSVEGLSVLPSRLCHHLKPLPIPVEEAEGTGPHAKSLQDSQAPGPIQGIVCLVQVQ